MTWSGKYRPALRNLPIYPRPLQDPLPVWIGVGGTPESFARAGSLGLPLMVAVIGVILLAGDQTPYVPSREQAAEVRREMREAILRGGE